MEKSDLETDSDSDEILYCKFCGEIFDRQAELYQHCCIKLSKQLKSKKAKTNFTNTRKRPIDSTYDGAQLTPKRSPREWSSDDLRIKYRKTTPISSSASSCELHVATECRTEEYYGISGDGLISSGKGVELVGDKKKSEKLIKNKKPTKRKGPQSSDNPVDGKKQKSNFRESNRKSRSIKTNAKKLTVKITTPTKVKANQNVGKISNKSKPVVRRRMKREPFDGVVPPKYEEACLDTENEHNHSFGSEKEEAIHGLKILERAIEKRHSIQPDKQATVEEVDGDVYNHIQNDCTGQISATKFHRQKHINSKNKTSEQTPKTLNDKNDFDPSSSEAAGQISSEKRHESGNMAYRNTVEEQSIPPNTSLQINQDNVLVYKKSQEYKQQESLQQGKLDKRSCAESVTKGQDFIGYTLHESTDPLYSENSTLYIDLHVSSEHSQEENSGTNQEEIKEISATKRISEIDNSQKECIGGVVTEISSEGTTGTRKQMSQSIGICTENKVSYHQADSKGVQEITSLEEKANMESESENILTALPDDNDELKGGSEKNVSKGHQQDTVIQEVQLCYTCGMLRSNEHVCNNKQINASPDQEEISDNESIQDETTKATSGKQENSWGNKLRAIERKQMPKEYRCIQCAHEFFVNQNSILNGEQVFSVDGEQYCFFFCEKCRALLSLKRKHGDENPDFAMDDFIPLISRNLDAFRCRICDMDLESFSQEEGIDHLVTHAIETQKQCVICCPLEMTDFQSHMVHHRYIVNCTNFFAKTMKVEIGTDDAVIRGYMVKDSGLIKEYKRSDENVASISSKTKAGHSNCNSVRQSKTKHKNTSKELFEPDKNFGQKEITLNEKSQDRLNVKQNHLAQHSDDLQLKSQVDVASQNGYKQRPNAYNVLKSNRNNLKTTTLEISSDGETDTLKQHSKEKGQSKQKTKAVRKNDKKLHVEVPKDVTNSTLMQHMIKLSSAGVRSPATGITNESKRLDEKWDPQNKVCDTMINYHINKLQKLMEKKLGRGSPLIFVPQDNIQISLGKGSPTFKSPKQMNKQSTMFSHPAFENDPPRQIRHFDKSEKNYSSIPQSYDGSYSLPEQSSVALSHVNTNNISNLRTNRRERKYRPKNFDRTNHVFANRPNQSRPSAHSTPAPSRLPPRQMFDYHTQHLTPQPVRHSQLPNNQAPATVNMYNVPLTFPESGLRNQVMPPPQQLHRFNHINNASLPQQHSHRAPFPNQYQQRQILYSSNLPINSCQQGLPTYAQNNIPPQFTYSSGLNNSVSAPTVHSRPHVSMPSAQNNGQDLTVSTVTTSINTRSLDFTSHDDILSTALRDNQIFNMTLPDNILHSDIDEASDNLEALENFSNQVMGSRIITENNSPSKSTPIQTIDLNLVSQGLVKTQKQNNEAVLDSLNKKCSDNRVTTDREPGPVVDIVKSGSIEKHNGISLQCLEKKTQGNAEQVKEALSCSEQRSTVLQLQNVTEASVPEDNNSMTSLQTESTQNLMSRNVSTSIVSQSQNSKETNDNTLIPKLKLSLDEKIVLYRQGLTRDITEEEEMEILEKINAETGDTPFQIKDSSDSDEENPSQHSDNSDSEASSDEKDGKDQNCNNTASNVMEHALQTVKKYRRDKTLQILFESADSVQYPMHEKEVAIESEQNNPKAKGNKIRSRVRGQQKLVENPFKCSQCSLSFKKEQTLEQHINLHNKNPLMCWECSMVFIDSKAYEKHVTNFHL